MVSALLNWMYYIKYTKVQVEYKKKSLLWMGRLYYHVNVRKIPQT